MSIVVLDASVVVKWITPRRERGIGPARRLQDWFVAGELAVIVPALLFIEVLNAAASRWRWPPADLLDLAAMLGQAGFHVGEPSLGGIAAWAGHGLTAYDAAYVALAEEQGVPLVTDDESVLERAPEIAVPLREAARRPPRPAG